MYYISLAQLFTKYICSIVTEQESINKFNCNPHIRAYLILLGLSKFSGYYFLGATISQHICTLSGTVISKVLQNFHLARPQTTIIITVTSNQLQVNLAGCIARLLTWLLSGCNLAAMHISWEARHYYFKLSSLYLTTRVHINVTFFTVVSSTYW